MEIFEIEPLNQATDHKGISVHPPLDCLFNQQLLSSWHQTKHQRSASLASCEGEPPVTRGFPWKKTSNVESMSLAWWHDKCYSIQVSWLLIETICITDFSMCNNTRLWLKLSFVANHSTKISLSCIKLPKGWRFVNNSTVFKSELANSRGGETPKVTFKVSLHHSETFPSSTAYGLAWHDCFWEIHARPPHLHPIQTVLPYKYANTRIRFIKLESMISLTLLYTSLPYCYGFYQPVVRDFYC